MDEIKTLDITVPTKHLPMKVVSQRYGVVSRTIDRWLLQPQIDFPRPLIINRRRYWREVDLVGWENARSVHSVGGR
jgi:predicted DNA-binding transcriptional regulator AlpA